MEINVSEDVERRANKLLIANGIKQDIPYIVLAPEARHPKDRYNPDHFAAVARILAAQTELQILIIGSSERAGTIQPVLQVADENLYGNVSSLIGKTTIPELAAIIRQAGLIITNKSASMRIADSFHCPMIILCPRTDDISPWRPRNPSVRLLCRPTSCSICDEFNCAYGMKCLEIRPEEVAIAALEMLSNQTYPHTTYHVLQEYRSEVVASF